MDGPCLIRTNRLQRGLGFRLCPIWSNDLISRRAGQRERIMPSSCRHGLRRMAMDDMRPPVVIANGVRRFFAVAVLLGWWRWEYDTAARNVPAGYVFVYAMFSDVPMLTLLHSPWHVYVPVLFGLGCGVYWIGCSVASSWLKSSKGLVIRRCPNCGERIADRIDACYIECRLALPWPVSPLDIVPPLWYT